MSTMLTRANAKPRLMVGGPTPVPPEVTAAGTLPVIDERTDEFAAILHRVSQALASLMGTEHQVLTLTASATGAMESVVQNLFSPGDRVLVAVNGYYGERWAEMCRAYRLDVVVVAGDWGYPLDLPAVGRALADGPTIRAGLCVHGESSTGMLNDLRGFAEVVDDRLCVVDATASLGAAELRMDDWGVDVAVAGSQKALMTPPGVSFVGASERALAATERATTPRYYFDWTLARSALAQGRTPWTPAVGLIRQLAAALDRLAEEGLDAALVRHARMAAATRAGCRAIGLPPVVAGQDASPAMTAVWLPASVPAPALVDRLAREHGIQLVGGSGDLIDRVLRIGHCGYIDDYDILCTLVALESVLYDCGVVTELGAAARAAQIVFAGVGGQFDG